MDVHKVREELMHNLHEWGVSGRHKEHLDFRKDVIEEGINMASLAEGLVSFDDLEYTSFPETIHEAYEKVLVSEVENLPPEKCVSTTDKLDVEGFGEPKFRWFNKRSAPPKVNGYRVKRQYQHLSDSELDPLHRYEYETLPKDEYFFRRWFVDQNIDSELGTFFEAWFACHAIQEEACFNCGCKKTLRWAGGCGSSWQDLICVACGCMYELKTKASLEKINKVFHYNRLPCGSFKKYCMIENCRSDDQKMFIAMLPRESTLDSNREESHPVMVTEIKSIRPKLFEGTFNPNSPIRLKTVASMNLETKSKWFDLPAAENVSLKDTMKKVFLQVFGQEKYESCLKKSLTSSGSLCSDSSSKSSDKDITAQLNRLAL